MPTFMPCPIARTAMPSAADVLPLAGPVWTMIRPFSTVLVASFFAWAAWTFLHPSIVFGVGALLHGRFPFLASEGDARAGIGRRPASRS